MSYECHVETIEDMRAWAREAVSVMTDEDKENAREETNTWIENLLLHAPSNIPDEFVEAFADEFIEALES